MATKTAIPPPGYTEFLTRREVAARFGVAPQTITRWANEGILASVRTLHGQRRYPANEVERLVSSMWEHAGLPATRLASIPQAETRRKAD